MLIVAMLAQTTTAVPAQRLLFPQQWLLVGWDMVSRRWDALGRFLGVLGWPLGGFRAGSERASCHKSPKGPQRTLQTSTRTSPEILPRHPIVCLQIVVQHIDADHKVAGVERIAPVPALGSKLPPLSDDGMEVAEREQDTLELGLLAAHLHCVL